MRYKLVTNPEQARAIDETLGAFHAACLWIHDELSERILSSLTIHAKFYQSIRDRFQLPANLAVRVIGKVSAVRVSAAQSGTTAGATDFDPNIAEYDNKIISLRRQGWSISIALIAGRTLIELDINQPERDQLVQTPLKRVRLIRDGKDYYIEL